MAEMTRPRLLDLYSGAGGAAVGYHRAGFDVVGVDVHPQPNYPFEHHVADALTFPLDGYDAIHASPPCQAYSTLGAMWNVDRDAHPDLVDATRQRLQASGVPWVMENVVGAPLATTLLLCGSMFGLRVRRHRLFETNVIVLAPDCRHTQQGQPLGVYGLGGGGQMTRGRKATRTEAPAAMGIDWMTHAELSQAIPPAYCEFIGHQLAAHLEVAA